MQIHSSTTELGTLVGDGYLYTKDITPASLVNVRVFQHNGTQSFLVTLPEIYFVGETLKDLLSSICPI